MLCGTGSHGPHRPGMRPMAMRMEGTGGTGGTGGLMMARMMQIPSTVTNIRAVYRDGQKIGHEVVQIPSPGGRSQIHAPMPILLPISVQLQHFYGFPAPHPQANQETDDDPANPRPSTSGSAGAQGGAPNPPPTIPSSAPRFHADDQHWRDAIETAVQDVLRMYGGLDILLLFQELRALLGDRTIGGLAQHLIDSGRDLPVNDFILRVLWDGHARGLWDRKGDEWKRK